MSDETKAEQSENADGEKSSQPIANTNVVGSQSFNNMSVNEIKERLKKLGYKQITGDESDISQGNQIENSRQVN